MTAKTPTAKPVEQVRHCHFCERELRLTLVRLSTGGEGRLVWACPNHRG